jgi:hypothetical protein
MKQYAAIPNALELSGLSKLQQDRVHDCLLRERRMPIGRAQGQRISMFAEVVKGPEPD